MAEREWTGKPKRLTDQIRVAVCQYLADGTKAEVAVRAAGIDLQTHASWMERGELEGRSYTRHRRYRAEVLEALARSEAEHVRIVARAARKDWRAAAFLLERGYAERWARRPGAAALPSLPVGTGGDPDGEQWPGAAQVGPDGEPL